MSLNIIRHKYEADGVLLSVTKNCEVLFHQTHSKRQKRLKIRPNKPSETFSFKPFFTSCPDSEWLVGLGSLEE